MNSGTILALCIMLGIVTAAWYLTRKNKLVSETHEFDERQNALRASGFRIGFFTALILLVVLILLLEMDALTVITPGFAAFAVLIISIVTFAIFCITHDAFLGVQENAKNRIFLFSMVVIVEAFLTVRHFLRGEMLENGRLTFSAGSPVLVCIGFLAILITLIVKTIRNGKEAEE